MLFVTDTFLLFFLIVFIIFWTLPPRYRINFLIFASIFFYASWNVAFAFHFALVITINYAVMEIWKSYRQKWIFVILQIANVANIAFFKYYYFFADFLGAFLGFSSLRHPLLLNSDREVGREIFLPLAISFYTFQIMAYGFDIYRGTYKRNHRFRDVILFKSFFPQLIAGPIMRSSELLPQISDYLEKGKKNLDATSMKKGLWLVLIGVVKKLFVADQLLPVITPIFSSPVAVIAGYSPLALWLCMFCSFIFLYADFSAYSDLARGLGLLLGFKIPINFRAPLFSHSISEFWRRWHLTFSLWIRDYIFIPLGGSRVPEWRIYFNLLFMFFIGGLWHGASYTFVFWGLFIGIVLSIEAFLKRRGFSELPSFLPWRIGRIGLTWVIILMQAPFFFAPSPEKLNPADSFSGLKWSFYTIGQMFDISEFFNDKDLRFLSNNETIISSIIALVLFNWLEEKPGHFSWVRRYENWLLPLAGIIVIFAAIEFVGGKKDFFYFQF